MTPQLQDTIVALSSAPGPGVRGVVRLSGPAAFRVLAAVFHSPQPIISTKRFLYEGELHLPDVAAPLPADLYVWPEPRTYTGQDLAELHTVSSPPLIDLLVARLLGAGARAAQSGEFTLRAFLAGKLDLTRVEATLAVIESSSRDELKQALAQLAGGITRPLQELREDLLNLLADVEAGLDFADEEIHFISPDELLKRLAKGLALVTLLGKQLDRRSLGGRPFRVVLAGPSNAGKSSLFNALGRSSAALVSPQPGTTRDYLVQRLEMEGVSVELVDTAGTQSPNSTIHAQAQQLGRRQAELADLILYCQEGRSTSESHEDRPFAEGPAPVVHVATKCDLTKGSSHQLATSAVTGEGLSALRDLLAERARAQARPALAPSLSRCRHHIGACLRHLRRAHATVLDEDPPELLALAVREALEELGAMVGAVYTDDLLDRIFSRFCIGK